MRALRVHERGGAERLVYEEAPLPFLGIGDALVRVGAASFTPTELEWPSTWVDRAGRDRLPMIPFHEVSGMVVELGYGTTGLAIGDAVYGLSDWYRDGAAAEYVAVEARNLAPRPAALGDVEAAAAALAGLTAWQALFVHGGLTGGQTVLVHGAAGGVGTMALQIARSAGARIIATGRAGARDVVADLGADEFVDVDEEPFEDAAARADVVVDLLGGDVLRRSLSAVEPGSVVVSAVEPPPPTVRPGVRAVFFVVEANRHDLVELSRRIDSGQVRPVVGQVFPLAGGREAFEAKAAGGIRGKAVLQVA